MSVLRWKSTKNVSITVALTHMWVLADEKCFVLLGEQKVHTVYIAQVLVYALSRTLINDPS